MARGGNLSTLEGHQGFVTCLAYSPDGRHLASGSADNTLRVWDISTETSIATVRVLSLVCAVVFCGYHGLAIGCENGEVYYFELDKISKNDMWMRWRTNRSDLIADEIKLGGVKGLSELNRRLLEQKGFIPGSASSLASTELKDGVLGITGFSQPTQSCYASISLSSNPTVKAQSSPTSIGLQQPLVSTSGPEKLDTQNVAGRLWGNSDTTIPELIQTDQGFFHVLATLGDGACAMHALLGQVNSSGYYQYLDLSLSATPQDPSRSDIGVRKLYREKVEICREEGPFREKFIQIGVLFLREAIRGVTNPSINALFWSQVPEALQKQVMECRLELAQYQSTLKSLRESRETLMNELLSSSSPCQDLMAPFLQGDKQVADAMEENWSSVLSCVGLTNPFVCRVEETKQKADLLTRREELLLRNVIASDLVFRHYLKAILKKEYWFSTFELHLAAHFFNKKVDLYIYTDVGNIVLYETYNASSNPLEEVSILMHRESTHFSRLKKVKNRVEKPPQVKRPLPTDIAVNASDLVPRVAGAEDFMESGDTAKMEGVVVAVQPQEAEENPNKRARSNEPCSHP